jgi:hypothetical protein
MGGQRSHDASLVNGDVEYTPSSESPTPISSSDATLV